MLKRLLLISVLLILSLSAVVGVQAQATTAQLRIVHAVPDAPAVDVIINGSTIAEGVEYGDATLHFTVPAGEVRVTVQTEDGTAVYDQGVLVDQNLAFSLILSGSAASLDGFIYEDNLDPLTLGEIRLTAIHAVQGVGAVDVIRASGAPLMTPVTYGQAYGTINIPAGVYDLLITPNGSDAASAIAETGELSLSANVLYSVVVTPDQLITLATPVKPGAGDVYTRLAHAAADAPAVDVYVDDVLIIPNFEFGSATGHIPFPSGDHELALREAGTPANSDAIFSTAFTIGDAPQTFAVVASDGGVGVVAVDDAADVSASSARVQVLNFSGDAVSVDVGESTLEADASAASEGIDLDPAEYSFGGDAEFEQTLLGGVLYSVLIFDADTTILAATPLALEPGSTPFEQSAEVAAAPVEEAPAADDAAAETEATLPPVEPAAQVATAEPVAEQPAAPQPATAQAAEPPAAQPPAQPTVVPPAPEQPAAPEVQPPTAEAPAAQPPAVAQPNARPTRPGIFPPVDVIFGVVNLNQGVNLQCREYPSSQARSLGLIPNNTELVVQGLFGPRDETGDVGRFDAILIEGVPDFSELATEDFAVADIPAATIEALDRDLWWLNVDWRLEDGTPFGCWVSAEYVQINYRNNFIEEPVEYLDLIDARNIDVVPYNVPGGPRDPDVQVDPAALSQPTPRGPENILATVNVNRGVNLQLRRTPGVDSESLSLVPGGAQLIVFEQTDVAVTGNVGEPTIPEWLYVEYLTAENQRVRGWISAEFVILTLGGRLYALEDVPVAETPQNGGFVIDDDVVVDEAPAAQPPAQGQPAAPENVPPSANIVTATLLTDPGTETNLRDRPALEGIVRATMPSGTVLTVLGRNADATWVEVLYATTAGDVRGWVSAQFLQVSFGGNPYDVNQLPVTSGEAAQ